MIVVGIDPGMKGGVAVYNSDTNTMVARAMPTYGGRIDGDALKEMLPDRGVVYIEEQRARPPDGRVGAMTMGRGYEAILIAVEDKNLEYVLPTPHEWQDIVFCDYDLDDYGMNWKESKIASIDHVMYNWPSVDLSPGRMTLPHDGIADAVCLAEYGMNEEGLIE